MLNGPGRFLPVSAGAVQHQKEESNMAKKLQGAYVRAWVWVYLDCPDDEVTDDEIGKRAKARWSSNSDVEIDLDVIDPDAKVSRSYKDG